jgi:hypothetical protein
MTKPCLSASNQGIAEELVVRFSGKNYLPVVAGPDDVLRLAGDDVTGVGLWASMEIGFRAGVSDLLTLDRVQSIRPYLKSMC